jgi:hypothetical protein
MEINKRLMDFYLHTPAGQKILTDCAFKMPKAEIAALVNQTGTTTDSVELAHSLALNRLTNRICNHCWNKKNIAMLQACAACGMTWYCNEACRAADKENHSKWCCNPDAKPDQGPLKVVVLVKV